MFVIVRFITVYIIYIPLKLFCAQYVIPTTNRTLTENTQASRRIYRVAKKVRHYIQIMKQSF